DLAVLAIAFLQHFPQHYPLFAQRSVTIGKRSRGTVDPILGAYEGADGMKTGFTCASGYNMVASAARDGRRLIGVVLGSRNGGQRSKDMTRLLDAGFAGGAPPTVTLIGYADQMTDVDDGDPPIILAGGACTTPQLIGSDEIIDSPAELSGWAVVLGDYRNRAKARQALRTAQTHLGNTAGRPAIIKQGANGLV